MAAVTPHDRYFVPLFGGAVACAWAALLVWDSSPYARYLDHDWANLGLVGNLCASLPMGDVVVPAVLFVSGWTLMTAAMMLPTTLPLVGAFRRLARLRADGPVLLGLLLVGYLAVWLAFGLAAHLAGLGLLALVRRSAWLTFNGWLISSAMLLLAGLYQFSPLKRRCLEACHSPLSFVLRYWHGMRPRSESLRLGMAHGLYCVGCCWPLMLLMFAVGTGSVAWMLGLGAVMALEKNSPWGRALSAPLGIALVVIALGMVVHGAMPRLIS